MKTSWKSIIYVEVSCNPNYIPTVGMCIISGLHKFVWKEGFDGAVRVLLRGDKKVAALLYPDGGLCLYGDAVNLTSMDAIFGFIARIGLTPNN